MKARRFLSLLPTALMVLACSKSQGTMPKAESEKVGPTVEEARLFLDKVDKDLRRLWTARDRAAWVSQNFITDDTEALSANGEEATAQYVNDAIALARRFKDVKLPVFRRLGVI